MIELAVVTVDIALVAVSVLVGLIVGGAVLVAMCRRRVPVEPAPLESGEAREAIRAAIERRSPR